MGRFSVRTASLYQYISRTSLAIEWQVESLVFYQSIHILLYFLPERQPHLTSPLLLLT
jgi:hypothetical protein